ncbi:MAG: hypothetical protein AAGK37_09410 [Pseudomonadota bacterium]
MRALVTFLFAIAPAISGADPAVVESVEARPAGSTWTFSVTLSHGDTGWDDYADGWRVVLADGTVLGTRELLHPHVEEQPFTRSLSGVSIPDGTEEVYIEARTNTDGWDDARMAVALP